MIIAVVVSENGKRRILWGRAFLALAWINTILEVVAFGIYFREGGSFRGALPFVLASALALSMIAVGFIYWLWVPVQRLPSLDDKP